MLLTLLFLAVCWFADPIEKDGKSKQGISYIAEREVGNGSFGVVYQATLIETQETVAIKKVLQDRRFKNRELQIMGMLDHPCVVSLKHCFFSQGDRVSRSPRWVLLSVSFSLLLYSHHLFACLSYFSFFLFFNPSPQHNHNNSPGMFS